MEKLLIVGFLILRYLRKVIGFIYMFLNNFKIVYSNKDRIEF